MSYILSQSFFVLTIIGLWKPLNWTGLKSIFYYFYSFVIFINSIIFISTGFIELIFFNNGVFDFFNNASMPVTIIGMCCKLITVIYNRQKIISILNSLEKYPFKLRDQQEKIIHQRFDRTIRSNTSAYIIFFEMSVTVFILGKIFENRPFGILPCRAWFPYNYASNRIIYHFTSVQQLISVFISANVDIGFDTLFLGLSLLMCCQVKKLKYRFKLMIDKLENMIAENGSSLESVKIREAEQILFSDCVNYHSDILRTVETVNFILSKMMFIQYSFSSIILCSSVYTLSQLEPFSPEYIACLVYIFCMLIQIFVLCISGHRITTEFSDLITAMYSTNWFVLKIRARKFMLMMMMRSLKPVVLSSGHIVTLSLDSFKNLLKLSYTIYNLLQQTSQ